MRRLLPPRAEKLVLLVAVVAVALALAVGAGAFGGPAPKTTLYQKTLQLAGEYRCPVCQGESAAVSGAPEAVEIRSLIAGWLERGRTDAEIRSALVADYGNSILERPPASGISTLLWALPVIATASAIGGLGLAFRRWRRASWKRATEKAEPVKTEPVKAEGVKAEGVKAEAGLNLLRWARGSERYRRATLGAGVALVALAGALWVVDRTSTQRPPGGTATGGQASTSQAAVTQELQAADALSGAQPAAALALYDEVLAAHPDEPAALASEGFIYARAGMPGKALGLLSRAEKVDPSFAPAHLYRGLVLLDYLKKPGEAAPELRWYLAHGGGGSGATVAREALSAARAELGAHKVRG